MDIKKVILLADDEQDILDVYSVTLERAGFEVITAHNGSEAVILAKEKRPNLVLMDLKMPIMDGIEATTEIVENPETKDIKVVFLTAFSDPNAPEIDIKAAKEIGAFDFIKKGIGLTEFVEKVKEYVK